MTPTAPPRTGASDEAREPAEQAENEQPQQEEQEEQEVVAVGTVAHVIRRAFREFYAPAAPSASFTESRTSDVGTDDAQATESGGEANRPVPEPTNTYVALAESRKSLLRERLATTQATANGLLAFLDLRCNEARAEDKAIAADLARQGLVIKTQIPMGPSNLRLDPHELNAFGAIGETLIHAKELVGNFHRERLNQSGNGPQSIARKVAGIHREPPGYLNTTGSYDIRKDTTLSVHQHHIETVKASEKPAEAKTATATGDTHGNKDAESDGIQVTKSDVMPAPERRKNMEILQRMQTKLDFLRNPRYIVQPSDDPHGGASDAPSFVAVPSPVEFTDYDIGGIYEQTVYLRNTTGLSRRIRVLPPATIYFSIEIAFPDASGIVAPGMHVAVKLRFAPDSRADYKDAMAIQYEGSGGQSAQFHVPVLAHRKPPELSIPLLLRAQHTLVGSQSITRIPCKNTGGKARFWLMTEADWNRCETTAAFRSGGTAMAAAIADVLTTKVLSVGPFEVTPNEVELDSNESITLALSFLPSGIGEQREKFVMVCDNCLVRVFQLVGRGCQVELSITGVNEAQPIDLGIPQMGRVSQLVFQGEQLIHSTRTQRFTVLNETPIDLTFQWQLQSKDPRDEHCPYGIEPQHGVLGQTDTTKFVVTFTPHSARRFFSWRLVLCINDVPACSLPGPNQLQLIADTYLRLRDAQRLRTGKRGEADVVSAAEPVMESMSVALCGTGRLGTFSLQPSAIQLTATTQELMSAQPYTVRTRLVNECDARVSVSWDLKRARLTRTSHTNDTLFEVNGSGDDHVTLEPRGSRDVELSLTPLAAGAFSVIIPFAVRDPLTPTLRAERWLMVNGLVARPQLRIASAEVDFGLVLVSASAECDLTIRNDSPVAPADWTVTHLEAPTPTHSSSPPQAIAEEASPLPSQPLLSARGGLRRVGSRDSISSKHSASSSNRTDRSSVGSLGLFSNRDLAPRASLSFSPSAGQLRPGESLQVRVTCHAGSLPERFRGTIALLCSEPSLLFPGCPAQKPICLSSRAEIQSPNVLLTPLKLSLGTTYLGVRVQKHVQLVNLSNLEADFKFMEPRGPSKAYSIEFSPKQGVLRSKATLSVRVAYTPRQAGKTSTLLACSVKGLSGPLGFEIASNHKGLVLTYDVLPAGAALPSPPREVALSRGISVEDGDFEPDASSVHALPRLNFGDSIPLTERRSLRLLLRNFSGIEAQVELEPKRYAAYSGPELGTSLEESTTTLVSDHSTFSEGKHSRRAASRVATRVSTNGTRSSGSSSMRKKLLLTDEYEPSRRFQSEPGRAYIREQEHAKQDRALLHNGHGVAFFVSTTADSLQPLRSIRIPPWGQAVVWVTCFNNMPGTFTDTLASRATGLSPVLLPLHATVAGSPVTLDANCVGLRQPKRGSLASFAFGHVCVRSPAITKTLRVVNRGPKGARIKWKLVEPGQEDQVVQVSLRVDFSARVQLRITPLADNDPEYPFEIVPAQSMVEPFSTGSFNVTFFPSTSPSSPRVLLVADAHWIDSTSDLRGSTSPLTVSLDHTVEVSSPLKPEATDSRCESPSSNSSAPPTSARLATAAGKAIQAVRVANSMYRSTTPHPLTAMHSSSTTPRCIRAMLCADVVEPELFLDQPRHNVVPPPPFHVKFTTWSTLLSSSYVNHELHRRELSLINHLNARVTFRLECVGPFAVVRAESLAPKHPLATSDLPPAHRRADGESFLFTLPPQMSVRIEIRVDPSKISVADTSKDRLTVHVTGELLVRFTNQSVQCLNLVAEVLRPMVLVSPSVFSFGRVHLSRSRSAILRVANTTAVPAAFSVRHMPRPTPLSRAQKQEIATHHAHFVDDPSVFTFAITQGVVEGPTVSLRSAGGAPQPATNSCQDLIGAGTRVVFAPLEVRVTFQPKEMAKHYKCRFRLVVAHGVDFDVVLDGSGHLDEVEYHDQDRPMVRAAELTHKNLIFKRLALP